MAAILALCGAVAWGIGDFLGGVGARRVHVLTVLLISQAAGLAGVLIWAAVSGVPLPGAGDALPAAAAGAAGLVGLGALYRGFAVGAMGSSPRSRVSRPSCRSRSTSPAGAFRQASSG